jgi:hypothetical protein
MELLALRIISNSLIKKYGTANSTPINSSYTPNILANLAQTSEIKDRSQKTSRDNIENKGAKILIKGVNILVKDKFIQPKIGKIVDPEGLLSVVPPVVPSVSQYPGVVVLV